MSNWWHDRHLGWVYATSFFEDWAGPPQQSAEIRSRWLSDGGSPIRTYWLPRLSRRTDRVILIPLQRGTYLRVTEAVITRRFLEEGWNIPVRPQQPELQWRRNVRFSETELDWSLEHAA